MGVMDEEKKKRERERGKREKGDRFTRSRTEGILNEGQEHPASRVSCLGGDLLAG